MFLCFWLPKIPCIIITTSYCWPNLEELCNMWTDDVNSAANLPDYCPVNWEDLGTRLSCFGSEYKNGGTFHLFHEEEIG